jgi:hypothetical protein
MGNNVDLCQMLGVPSRAECPRCRREVPTCFDDYDIECGNPNPEPGVWSLSLYCPECEHEWKMAFKVLPGEVETLRKKLHDAQACLADIIDFDGFSHDDPECPENADECRCANAAKINAAMEGYVSKEELCRTADG